MAKLYPDRHKSDDAEPLSGGRSAMLTVFIFIVLFIVGSLMISGYFSTTGNKDASNDNKETRVKP